jgi:hypothetical protein
MLFERGMWRNMRCNALHNKGFGAAGNGIPFEESDLEPLAPQYPSKQGIRGLEPQAMECPTKQGIGDGTKWQPTAQPNRPQKHKTITQQLRNNYATITQPLHYIKN